MTNSEAPLATGGNVWVPPNKKAMKLLIAFSVAAIIFFLIPLFYYQDYPTVSADGTTYDISGDAQHQQVSIFWFRLVPNTVAVILLSIGYAIFHFANRHGVQDRRNAMFRMFLVAFVALNLFTSVRTFMWNIEDQSEWVAEQLNSSATGVAMENGLPVDLSNWVDGSVHTITLSDGTQETFTVERTGNSITGLLKPGEEPTEKIPATPTPEPTATPTP